MLDIGARLNCQSSLFAALMDARIEPIGARRRSFIVALRGRRTNCALAVVQAILRNAMRQHMLEYHGKHA
jgi:hypothetical protein